MMKSISTLGKLLLVSLTLFFSCTENDNEGNARLKVNLVDSPGDYEAVFVQVLEVEINVGSDESEGWISLDVQDSTYNLLELTGGVEATLSDVEIPAGKISQIRLVLGDDNAVVLDGDTLDLTVPSGSASGLKLNVNETFLEGITYELSLDFDAARSVVKAGNSGRFNLKPVIRVISEATNGAIQGNVTPDSVSVAVFAIVGQDTVAGTFAPKGSAGFLIPGLSEGMYTVALDPGSNAGFQQSLIENVSVTNGNVTNLGDIVLSE